MKKTALRTQNKKRKGFTLVELIIVIAILAVLSVGAIIGFGNTRQAAEDAVARANAGVIVRSLNTYNTLANTPREGASDGDAATPTQVANLALTAGTDATQGLVTINLNIDASSEEITAALRFTSWDDTAGVWVVLADAADET